MESSSVYLTGKFVEGIGKGIGSEITKYSLGLSSKTKKEEFNNFIEMNQVFKLREAILIDELKDPLLKLLKEYLNNKNNDFLISYKNSSFYLNFNIDNSLIYEDSDFLEEYVDKIKVSVYSNKIDYNTIKDMYDYLEMLKERITYLLQCKTYKNIEIKHKNIDKILSEISSIETIHLEKIDDEIISLSNFSYEGLKILFKYLLNFLEKIKYGSL